jgi:hypothetical protein
MVLLRVCAPEVKKKFQKCETKMKCIPEKYLWGGPHQKSKLPMRRNADWCPNHAEKRLRKKCL